MNNPFYYTPSPDCRKAARELADWLSGKPSPFCGHPVDPAFKAEADRGKMFGVLVVDAADIEDGNHKSQTSILHSPVHYLAAYSGQVCGRADWPEFAPAVFDYLQPDGYFKQHEAEITRLNEEIEAPARPSPAGEGETKPLASGSSLPPPAGSDGAGLPPSFVKGRLPGETDGQYVRRRQFENAELHRWKLRQRALKAEAEKKAQAVARLKTIRRQKSDDLQRWLFRHFRFMNGKGETKNLMEINHAQTLPPSGSGECCEPKLLQYAFAHGLKPLSMAMFWWGESPKGEVRHHLHFYPACNSKCKPILQWMLQGIDVEPNPLESRERDAELTRQIKTLYEDADICIIVKPAGLLSVPGKSGRESVQSVMRRRYPDSPSPLIVHRLDMDTSGLMIIAKTLSAYHGLQRQFARHEVRKRYVAKIETPPIAPSPPGEEDRVPQETTDNDDIHPRSIPAPPLVGGGESAPSAHKGWGRISLPLRPDLDDRPRQMVDFGHGREAVTYYKMTGPDTVWLCPMTGRTHQLRVHCAHRLGLNRPIRGDALYGTPSDRLYLHAEEIVFRHPTTGRTMKFTSKAEFV